MALCMWNGKPSEEKDGLDSIQRMEKMERSTMRLIELMERTQYRITQVNGQRTFGPPPVWSGHPPSKDCEVFVGRIPRDCFEDELIPVLASVGRIYEFRLMMDFSGFNRGFGFALYSDPSEALKAIDRLNHYKIREGCTLGIVKSMNNCKLFIGGLDVDVTEEELLITLKALTGGVTRITVHISKSNSAHQRQKKYALIEYETHRAAAMARRILVPQKMRFRGVRIVVDWANPFGDDHQKLEKKMFQMTSPKHRDKRNNYAESKNKTSKAYGNCCSSDYSRLSPRLALSDPALNPLGTLRDGISNAVYFNNPPECSSNNLVPLEISMCNTPLTNSWGNYVSVGNLCSSNRNSNHILFIPQNITPVADLALQHFMFTAYQTQLYACCRQNHHQC